MKQTIEIPEGFELKKVSDTEYQIVKKETEFPKTWEEFCETHDVTKKERYITSISTFNPAPGSSTRIPTYNKNLLPNEEYAKAVLALCQLIQLRDCYRQEWKPDWTGSTFNKYCISFDSNGCVQINSKSLCKIFSFQSEEIRDKFLDNFRDLIEMASYLWK